MTSIDGKSAFPEDHPLALGTGGIVYTGPRPPFPARRPTWCSASAAASRRTASPARHCARQEDHPRHQRRARPQQDLRRRDRHPRRRQARARAADRGGAATGSARSSGPPPTAPGDRARCARRGWPKWQAKLASDERPINPYRVIARVHARRRPEGRHRHARLRQPARPAPAVLQGDAAAQLHGLGQVAPARHRARPHHRRQGRRTRQVLRQLHGRRRLRHDRPRLRDGGALPASRSAPSCSTTRPWRSRSRT